MHVPGVETVTLVTSGLHLMVRGQVRQGRRGLLERGRQLGHLGRGMWANQGAGVAVRKQQSPATETQAAVKGARLAGCWGRRFEKSWL